MNQRQFQHQLQTSYCSSVSENTLKFWNYGKLYSLSESKYLIKSKLNQIKSIKFKFEHLKLKLVQHLILVVMKIFVSVNENSLEGLGIYTTNPTEKFQRANIVNVLSWIWLLTGCFASFMYFFYECENFPEYAESAFTIASANTCVPLLLILMMKKAKRCKLTSDFERFIKRSKCRLPRSEHI